MASSKRVSPLVAICAAFQFLTLLPPIIRRPFTAQELGQSSAYYPLVGVVIGAFLWGFEALTKEIIPTAVLCTLILMLWVLSTGALHLDGFLDACDGLFGGHDPEKRLNIMRDERVGAFALAGGVLLLLLKYSALISFPPGIRPSALILAPTLGRWSMSSALKFFPYGRSQGVGRDIKDHTGLYQFFIATIIALVTAWLSAGWNGLLAMLATGLVMLAVARFALSRIPGLTGDIYGAICELTEVTVLVFLLVTA